MEYQIKAQVKEVCQGSIAEEAGIEAGDIICKINGEKLHDILEYKYLTSDEKVELEIIKSDGSMEVISIYNEEYEDLGIVFENPLIDKARSCSNKCIFCFIDQLPKGLRKTLYFKDDDSRLSFLQGNYVTLTNMTEEDIDRIIKLRLSPINISVHTTNGSLRIQMLGNKRAGNIVDIMKKLGQAQIIMNCQIVLCRDINDKDELDRTLEDLTVLYPYVNSVSVVPVGLTAFRDTLYHLKPFDDTEALKVIEQAERWQARLLNIYGSRIIYLADEFYILAHRQIPPASHYEDFPQIENGVGLIAAMQEEFDEGLKRIHDKLNIHHRNVSIATGIAAASFIRSITQKLVTKVKNLDVNVYPIKNEFFGETVTVAGLVTGRDLISQLKNEDLGSELLIPVSMLRSDRDIFLDNTSICDVENALNVKVTIVENDGYDFIRKVLGRND